MPLSSMSHGIQTEKIIIDFHLTVVKLVILIILGWRACTCACAVWMYRCADLPTEFPGSITHTNAMRLIGAPTSSSRAHDNLDVPSAQCGTPASLHSATFEVHGGDASRNFIAEGIDRGESASVWTGQRCYMWNTTDARGLPRSFLGARSSHLILFKLPSLPAAPDVSYRCIHGSGGRGHGPPSPARHHRYCIFG